jgi:hypothetical protein
MTKNTTPREQVIACRAELLANADALRSVETAPRDPAELAESIRTDLEGFAARSDARRICGEIAGPKRRGIPSLDAHLHADMPLTLADLAAILGPAAVAEGLAELIHDSIPRNVSPLKDADRERQTQTLRDARREIERREELAILAAQEVGENIPRRADADHVLLLEVWQ